MCIFNNSTLTILAIITAPLFAVLISLWVQDKNNKRQEKLTILKELMSHKKNQEEQSHKAIALNLNLIDVVFVDDKAVLQKYHVLRDVYLGSSSPNSSVNSLFVDLLKQIALNLGYKIKEVDLAKCVGFENLQEQAQPYKIPHPQ